VCNGFIERQAERMLLDAGRQLPEMVGACVDSTPRRADLWHVYICTPRVNGRVGRSDRITISKVEHGATVISRRAEHV
jgi:hypothetical protein